MPRHKMAPSTWGEIGYKKVEDGLMEGRVYYRTLQGARKDTVAKGKTKVAIERILNARLPDLVAAAPAGEIPAERLTFAGVARAW